MEVEKLPNGPLATNTYFAINEETNEAVIIDPASRSESILNVIQEEKLVPKAILLTHGHFDHIGGVEMLREKYGIPVYVHEEDTILLMQQSDTLGSFNENLLYAPADHTVTDGETLHLAGMDFYVIGTPGHSNGSVCYRVENVLFTGDTVFNLAIGRTDFIYGDPMKMKASLQKLLDTVTEDLVVHPGHGQSSSFFYEKNNNPYLNGEYVL